MSAELTTGTIEVDVARSSCDPGSLFGFAERRNPKRSFLFVSKVLGRHIPVAPAIMRRTHAALARQIPRDLPGPVLVIGMAETAVALGAGVHRAYAGMRGREDAVFLCTTRHALGSELLAEFSEEHSHAPGQLLHAPRDPQLRDLAVRARSLVLVDDEVSTGRTFANLCRALADAGLRHVEQVWLATLTDWSGGATANGIERPVRCVSILSGSYRWSARPGAVLPEVPECGPAAAAGFTPEPRLDWGRLGCLRHGAPPSPHARAGERILVVGTGEHVWRPFLVAEALEARGAEVSCSAVTRSPIAIGHAIRSRLCVTDSYGTGVPHYLYNVRPERYDRILLCSETPADSIDPALIAALRPAVICEIASKA